MIVAGAGGHALELLDILISQGMTENLYFFDGLNPISVFQDKYPVLKTMDQVKAKFLEDPRFILGTGNPKVRAMFFEDFTKAGGILFSVKGTGIAYSNFAFNNDADIFNLCFIGANTKIGKGSLINTGAQIHHEVKIGKFSEINPGAILLGKVEVGDFCSIGANATILPKVKIGNYVTVGAGSVVTHNVPDGVTVLGMPAKKILESKD
ncbi:sugar O-acyltransferase, sialic acid O-acetyltransferase NeuD family [Algoriphagus alkaliphilus]|uniref:Sugar O-acyltransferase, sialic acid O-acetyltransferase NeuD family n=1 Tax=Algoriphagus alkaliphilus TaxID=279824 RepID=A0A1G5ZNH4_9BACT|nr:acetyltransferase [Algoriphagus alkaliphilus]SDA96369.1 sugar O-acyltransferase, sialic acid O-acetyltransferase NeuD family [Algoriphagus alkaliphilus]